MKTNEKKKKSKTHLFLIGCGAVLITFVTGCSKNNPLNPAGNCFGGQWALQYADELQAWSNAATAYSENPTDENCANYKSSAKTYLDALDDIYDCVPTASRAEIDKAIKEAKDDIDNEACD